jgi:hypothetical protein
MSGGAQPGRVGQADPEVVGEPRWRMAGAVVGALVLVFLTPDSVRPGPSWLVPCSEACCSGP